MTTARKGTETGLQSGSLQLNVTLTESLARSSRLKDLWTTRISTAGGKKYQGGSSPPWPRADDKLCFMIPRRLVLFLLSAVCWAQPGQQANPQYPSPPVEGDWIARDFVFKSGEKLAELR